jgi:nucleotide-binding universal stress UspA family protein
MSKDAISRWSNPNLILVATDCFESDALLHHAISQARPSNAKVLLVHTIDTSAAETGITGIAPPQIPANRATKSKLDEMAARFLREGIFCEAIVLNGPPELAIPVLVKARSVDRVIVSPKNSSGVARLIEGSTMDRLIDVLNVPVCIVGQRAQKRGLSDTHFGRILFAASLHSTSARLAEFASALAEAHHAHLTLLHVLSTTGMSKRQHELTRLAVWQKLASLVPNNPKHRFQPLVVLREGDPATAIVEGADSLLEDLVIIGAPRTSGVSGVPTNGIVHRVVAETQCPVITLNASTSECDPETPESSPSELVSSQY